MASFVQQKQSQSRSPGAVNALKEEFEQLLKKEKVQKESPGGKRGGPNRPLWGGEKEGYFWGEAPPPINFPTLLNMNFVKNATNYSPQLVVGKPKVTKERKFARSINDLKYVTRSALAMPQELFWMKYSKGELPIQVPMKAKTVKQIVIVLLDNSGSMGEQEKMQWVTHIFNTLFEQIEKGNTIMYFTPFTYCRQDLIKVETIEDIKKLKEDFRIPHGGMTEVGMLLTELTKEIIKGKVDGFEVNPRTEVLVINDGLDVVEPIDSPVPIHSITLEDINNQLKEVCKTSGGQYFRAAGRSLQLL